MAQGNDTLETLIARGAYADAAGLCADRGDLRRAIALYERIWRFADAARLARALGDRPLAIRLSLDAHDSAGANEAAAGIDDGATGELAAAEDVFAARGHWHEAAALALRGGHPERAATCLGRAGAWLAAGELWERAGRWQEAGRLYEQQAAIGGPNTAPDAARAQLALGRLLAKLGRHSEAARALQAAARNPTTRRDAQRHLGVELRALGWQHAAREIARRLGPTVADAAAFAGGTATQPQVLAGAAGTALPSRFRALRLLGAGALGRVYAAEDQLLGQTVALKILTVGGATGGREQQGFSHFLREAEAARRLRHPNIVNTYDVDRVAGMLVLEYLPGGTLGDALGARGPLPAASVRRLALDILAGLGAAHARGIVHRDVKPANILFDAAGNAKLGDFGAAHLLDFGQTQTAGFIGTLAYLSPEQISGAPIGFAADLYALGATVYEALTGRRPFLGPDLVAQHLGETPPAPTHLSATLTAAHDQVLLRALAKAPRDRFASAHEMASAVAAWPDTEAETGAPKPAVPIPAGDLPDPIPRRDLGRTAHGRLYVEHDPRVARSVWVEQWDDAPCPTDLETLKHLAAAGGPHVQRILSAEPDRHRVTYEALEGEVVALHTLGAEDRAQVDAFLPALKRAGIDDPAVVWIVRTPGGPIVLTAPRTS